MLKKQKSCLYTRYPKSPVLRPVKSSPAVRSDRRVARSAIRTGYVLPKLTDMSAVFGDGYSSRSSPFKSCNTCQSPKIVHGDRERIQLWTRNIDLKSTTVPGTSYWGAVERFRLFFSLRNHTVFGLSRSRPGTLRRVGLRKNGALFGPCAVLNVVTSVCAYDVRDRLKTYARDLCLCIRRVGSA